MLGHCGVVGACRDGTVRIRGAAMSGEGGGTLRGEGRGHCAPMVVPFGNLREGSCVHMVEAPRRGTRFDGGHACIPVYTVITGVVGQWWASSACGTCWGALAHMWGGSQGSYRLPWVMASRGPCQHCDGCHHV